MAGIVFPDVAGSVLPALQIQKSQQLMDLEAARQRKLDADETRQQSAGQYIQGAVNGDPEAAANLARTNPTLFGHVQTLIASKDARKLQAAQENAKWLAGASGAVLEAPPEERATAYAQHLAELKARGIDSGSMPPTYTPAVDAYLRYHLNSGVSADKYLEMHMNTPQPMPGGGSTPGGPPVAPPGGPAPSQQDFINQMTPHAQMVSQQTGLDPRLVLAQSALETGYGSHAPGNNYFGIKGGEGPQLNTTEAGPGGTLVPAKASFRTYGSPGESAQDYAQFLTSNPRYAGVLAAKDLPSQIDAMGKSGYATDPNYAAKLRQIAFGLPTPQPGQATGPPVQLGGNVPAGAPMPQGGDQPTGNQPGVMPQAAPPPDLMTLHQYVQSVMPGAVMLGTPKEGPAYDHSGRLRVQLPDGTRTSIEVPKNEANHFEDVTDSAGNIIGQRNKTTNQYHPVQQVPGAGIKVDPKLTGEDVYQALKDAGQISKANEVKSIVDGDNPIPSANSRAAGAKETRDLVFQAGGPGFTDALHKQRMEMKTAMNKGPIGQQLQAQGTLFNHMDHALDVADELNNSPFPLANKALNAIGVGSGDPRVVEMQATKTRINQELEKYFAGHTTVSGLSEARDELNASQSPEQIKAAIKTLTTLVAGQQTELLNRINRGLGYTGDKKIGPDDERILTPEAAKARADVLARTQPNPKANSQLMDKGKELFGAPPRPQLGPPAPQQGAPAGSLPMPQKPAVAPPQGGNFIGNTPDGRPVYIMPDGSKVVPQ